MALINDEYKLKLKEEFGKILKDDVQILLFKDTDSQCAYCNDTEKLITELNEIDGRIKPDIHTINEDLAKTFGITKGPVLIMKSKHFQKGNIRYYGIPSGYEFRSIVEDIKALSTGNIELREGTIEKLKKIEKPINIKVFITPTCPYCPAAVGMAHKFAMVNENITGDMIESYEFNEMAEEAAVSSVPHTTITDLDQPIIGAQPEEIFLDQVLLSAEISS